MRAMLVVAGLALAGCAWLYARRGETDDAPRTSRPGSATAPGTARTSPPPAFQGSASVEADATPAPTAVPARPANPITAVSEAGFTNALEEQDALLEAMKDSGPPVGDWVKRGHARIDAVVTLGRDEALVEVESMGCFRAGCGARIRFENAGDTGRIERFIEAANQDGWPSPIVMTAPQAQPGGGADSYLFLVSPP